MSALVVCGKRSFDDDSPQQILHSHSSSSSSSPLHQPTKRARCGGANLSPPPPGRTEAAGGLFHLIALFPQMDPKILEAALEASGNDIETAIRSLNELRLESSLSNSASPLPKSENNNIPINEGDSSIKENGNNNNNNIPTEGSDWVELFVREMMNASDMDDARARASRALEVFEKSVLARNCPADVIQTLHKENVMLKEQVDVVLRENGILKKAVAIQHERQKEFEGTNQELHNLKQLAAQYQDQIRNLEITNYTLSMHLRQAQQSNSIPGRFHPDIF
ncbi:hypothetical protein LUZ60_017153 [Juncus effusus]|nr:hypothetical protein LUZ60_017153 [Juncus effusus]